MTRVDFRLPGLILQQIKSTDGQNTRWVPPRVGGLFWGYLLSRKQMTYWQKTSWVVQFFRVTRVKNHGQPLPFRKALQRTKRLPQAAATCSVDFSGNKFSDSHDLRQDTLGQPPDAKEKDSGSSHKQSKDLLSKPLECSKPRKWRKSETELGEQVLNKGN